ncbi:putative NBD/HSP70 family sugar kinase [Motilibacter peucedani]|uniref:Putative NBD/HSP70 family sugar kinase n=1 Tax=Motilibacter peucedani TaxID=598650 RepID=A0A420XTQ7_9ACTN|nr:ROK family protein [Motilibacter peucedani]RKS80039.1 putative NBD/HSP70 family sugar kinase [Motilibacter peucedani]
MSRATTDLAQHARQGSGWRSLTWPLGNTRRRSADPVGQPPSVAVADLRGRNAAVVLTTLRNAPEGMKVAPLADVTALSRPTIEVIVDDLKSVGLVVELPPTSSVGRPARRFAFNPGAAHVVGVDVRAHEVAASVVDLDGRVLARERKRVRRDLRGRARAAATVEVVRVALSRADVSVDTVAAAVVGTPGWVEDNARVRYVDNLRDWAETDIAGILAAELKCAVAVDNDANLAAVGEHSQGVAHGVDDLIFILLGERVGAGIIAGGRPLHGHHGAAGEIGFMVHPAGSRLAARAIGEKGKSRPGLDPLDFSAAHLAQGAPGDLTAGREDLESVGTRLAHALAPTLLALDPAMVVLGSNLFGAADNESARERVVSAAREEARALLVDPPEWRVSALGDDVVLAGAATFALSGVEAVLASEPLSLFPSWSSPSAPATHPAASRTS